MMRKAMLVVATGMATTAAIAQRQPAPPPPPPPSPPLTLAPVGPARLSLVIEDGRAFLIADGPGVAFERIELLDSRTAVQILADRRLAALWPQLTDWAGIDLVKLRTRAIDAARRAYHDGEPNLPARSAESSTRPHTRALMQFASALEHAGTVGEAEALLREALTAKRGVDSDWRRVERAMIAGRLSSTLVRDDRRAEAIALLEAEVRADPASDYAINHDVNRAALLAESGQHRAALALIERSLRDFSARADGAYGAGNEKMPGSMRQFGWIKACALHGLGRSAEAAALIDRVRMAPEPTDAVLAPIRNLDLNLRAAICMRDVDAVVRELAAELAANRPLAAAMVWLQPAFRYPGAPPALLEAVRRDPRMVAASRARLRVLPAEFERALGNWRGRSR